MDTYKIGVSIILTNSILPALTAMSAKFAGMNNTVTLLNRNLGAMKQIGLGVMGVMGGVAWFGGMAKLAEHGAKVNHQLELMKIAGMSNAEIQAATGNAMAVTSSNMTTHLSENLAHIRELRYAFGDVGVAMQHLDEISKSNTILNAIKGGGGDQVWELVKSLEMKGLTFDPAAFSSYVNTMTKVTEATGGKVTPKDFMSTFKYGRTAMLGWDENFVGGALPRLMQSMGSGSGSGGPGNALMSAFAKVVQGQMPKNAAEEFARMGLAPGGAAHIKGSADSQLPGGILGRDEFMKNPYEWVQKTLMPALSAHGVTEQNEIIAQISKMFPVRTASQIISEMGLQGRFHEGANSPFEKDIALQRGAKDQAPSFKELITNDYPTVMAAFSAQWKHLLEVLGSPLVAPGGPVLSAMAGIASAMNSVGSFAGAHPEGVKLALEVFSAIAGGLVVGGIVAVGLALGGLIGATGAITGFVAAVGALVALNWDKISVWLGGTQISDAITGAVKAIGSGIANACTEAVAAIGRAVSGIVNAIIALGRSIAAAAQNAASAATGGLIPRANTGGATGSWSTPGATGSFGGGRVVPNAYHAPRGGGSGVTHASLHIGNGQKLADALIVDHVRRANGPVQGSVYPDQTTGIPRNDSYRMFS